MAVEQGSRTETKATTSGRRGGKPNEQAIVPAVKAADAGATKVRPAGPPTRVGRGF